MPALMALDVKRQRWGKFWLQLFQTEGTAGGAHTDCRCAPLFHGKCRLWEHSLTSCLQKKLIFKHYFRYYSWALFSRFQWEKRYFSEKAPVSSLTPRWQVHFALEPGDLNSWNLQSAFCFCLCHQSCMHASTAREHLGAHEERGTCLLHTAFCWNRSHFNSELHPHWNAQRSTEHTVNC